MNGLQFKLKDRALIMRGALGRYCSVKLPQGSLPVLVMVKGGLKAWMNDAPATAPAGLLKVNRVELTIVSGMRATPPAPKPPRFTTPPGCVLKRLITVRVEKPLPSTVMVPPLWLMLVILSRAPIGTDTASLLAA
jgi:hypothetical protein